MAFAKRSCNMKKLILYVLFLFFVAACHNKDNNDSKSSAEEKSEKATEKKISRRDYSINGSNSYSDLFLDSIVVENYITSNTVNDTISRRIRSFYNTRN